MRYVAVIFDLDGTLCDPGPSIHDAIAAALVKLGHAPLDEATLRSFVGPPLADSLAGVLASPAEVEQAVELYRQELRTVGLPKYVVYDGVERLLQELRAAGVKTAVATSKLESLAQELLQLKRLVPWLDAVAGQRPGAAEPKAAVVARALAALGRPERAVMVGDRKHDIAGAQANGLDSIGVLYGYGSRAELEAAGATRLAASVAELRKLLAR